MGSLAHLALALRWPGGNRRCELCSQLLLAASCGDCSAKDVAQRVDSVGEQTHKAGAAQLWLGAELCSALLLAHRQLNPGLGMHVLGEACRVQKPNA
ncbi:hypothetical protein PSEUDO8AS_100326 [Pseudomonas sp. 8AS]|nr:hypothetical protein PSEUDO8AS_100326 [Pseudomonas sp. 8AS]